jgi:hypothetical protein
MIQVTGMIGEGFEFDTGKQTSKALVMTNGLSTINLEIDDQQAALVLSLWVDAAQPDVPKEKKVRGKKAHKAEANSQASRQLELQTDDTGVQSV